MDKTKFTSKKSRKKDNARHYKSKAPFKIDIMFYSCYKMLFSVLFFYAIYFGFVSYVRQLSYYTLLTEAVFIFFAMILSDMIGALLARQIDRYLIHRWGYIANSRNKKNKLFHINYYIYHTIIRTIFVISGAIWWISDYFYQNLSAPYYHLSFMIAWIFISLTSRFLAWVIANIVFKI